MVVMGYVEDVDLCFLNFSKAFEIVNHRFFGVKLGTL